MTQQEAELTKMPIYMVPKDKVAAIEHHLKDGDIIGIASAHDGGYCSPCWNYRQRQARAFTIDARLINPQEGCDRRHYF